MFIRWFAKSTRQLAKEPFHLQISQEQSCTHRL